MLLTQMVWTKNKESREKDEKIVDRYKAVRRQAVDKRENFGLCNKNARQVV